MKTFPSRFIRAGAGAGKTTTLIKTFFEFVEHYRAQKNKLPRVVITTFTRKATQEVKERLLKRALEIDDLNNDQVLFQYISKKSMVHISTIHGVLSLMLAKNHDLLGLNSDLKVSDHKSLFKIYYRELKFIFKSQPSFLELLEHYNFKDLVQLVIKFHEAASEHELKFVFKDQLLSLRKNIIKMALKDLEEILTQKLLVKEHKSWGPYFDFIENFYQVLGADQLNYQRLEQIYEKKPRKPIFSNEKPPFDSQIHEKIADYFSTSEFIDSLDSDEFIETHEVINKLFFQVATAFHQKMTQYKLQSGQISIADLETLSLKLIEEHPVAVQDFAAQYDYFMVDEYQDTSPLQVKILNALMEARPQFTVGDPQQSIYLFRGARAEVFLAKQALAEKTQQELVSLQTNYRSEHRLMQALNAITQNFSNQFSPMIPRQISDEDVTLTQAYYVKAEDEFVGLVNHILHLSKKGIPFGDMCILFTKNSDIFDFAKYALKYHIPVQPQIAAGFDQKREIIDLVCFLKFLVNPYDNLNLHTLLRSPWFDISDVDIFQIRQSSAQNFWTQLKHSQHGVALKLNQYLLHYRQSGVIEALEKFILESHFLKYSLYLDPTGKREANIYKFISNLKENLRSDQFLLNTYLSTQFSSFQEDLSSNLNESLALFSGNRVSLMTIHGAKGLEFKHVLLPGLCSRPKMTNQVQFLLDGNTQYYSIPILNQAMKLTWSIWGKQQKRSLNEKEYLEYERLFYVAVTRAEKSISFIAESMKKPTAGSWYARMEWPAVGEHQLENYSIESLDYGSEIQTSLVLTTPELKIKPQLNFKTQEQPSISVTDLISQDEGVHLKVTSPVIEQIRDENWINHLNKAQKGTDLHRLFEALKYLSESQVLKTAPTDEKKAVQWLFNQKQIPFRDILTQGNAEWGFGLQTHLGILQGQIDLWARLEQKIYILDYKTGSSLYSEKAFSQLFRYAECLKRMHFIKKTDTIQLVVLYPFEEKIVIQDVGFSQIADL